MITIQQKLQSAVQAAIATLFNQRVEQGKILFQKTKKEFEGDLTLVVFPFVKMAGKSPEATGELLGQYLKQQLEEIEKFNVVKGFLNLTISQKYWVSFFEHALQVTDFGYSTPDTKPRIMVEYSSPNTNKPLHLGHLRNIFLGYSVSKILKAAGHKVTKVQIINDRGIHICKSMWAWIKFGNGETPETSGMKGDKLVGKYYVKFDEQYKKEIAELVAKGTPEEEAKKSAPCIVEAQELLQQWEQKVPEVYQLWQTMNSWVYKGFDVSYELMGVDFDKLYYESDTYLLGREEVMKGLESGAFFRKDDGSIWIDLTSEGLDEKALLRRDGTAMYITQDIGTAILRFREYPDTEALIYTVGNEQEYHFNVLFKILKKLGYAQARKCHHLSYGMVELPSGKMKSREGTVVDADDIILEMAEEAKRVANEQGKLEGLNEEEKKRTHRVIGLAALKYFLLRVDPVKNMLFNPEESIDFNGNTGPFIQYSYVRTRSIMRKALLENSEWKLVNPQTEFSTLHLNDQELAIIKRLHEFEETISEAANNYHPGFVANYTYELVKEFNSFYHDCPILREENSILRSFRIALSVKTGMVIKQAMSLLGIDMPEKM